MQKRVEFVNGPQAEQKLANNLLRRTKSNERSLIALVVTSCAATPILASAIAGAIGSFAYPDLTAIPDAALGLLGVGAATSAFFALNSLKLSVFNVGPAKRNVEKAVKQQRSMGYSADSQLLVDTNVTNGLFVTSLILTGTAGIAAIVSAPTGIGPLAAFGFGGAGWLALKGLRLVAAHNRNNQARDILGQPKVGPDIRMPYLFMPNMHGRLR